MSDKDIGDLIPASPDYAGDTSDALADDKIFFAKEDPFDLFADWLSEALKSEPNDANAMSLGTVDADGLPNVRMVLLKHADADGFVWYTNYESAKGRELLGQGKAALCFHWKSLRRQVRVRGLVEPVSDDEADAYFQSRARDSRIGAWASEQSRPLEGRFALEARIAKYAAKYGLGHVPRPPHWSGFRLKPVEIEFWRDRPFRLHDRLVFRRENERAQWVTTRLFP
ncbi:MAG: pyridoxamine 5'-phosphate oxidase [Ponticaulis sp.]|nr:pyridoxamine 5'-phosphate oxidase [Ponticaulis sp.]|tara:strand:- start:4319 stop:4996 length:678 start_codon:yes stop_codon:yes gene_type:complete